MLKKSARPAHLANVGIEDTVAYIDETYEVDRKRGETFYVCAAVILKYSERQSLLHDLNGTESTYWHTTEELRDNNFQRVFEMLGHVNNGARCCVIAAHRPLLAGDRDGEDTRSYELERLIDQLSSAQISGVGGCPNFDPVRHFFIEERRPGPEQARDKLTAGNIRKAMNNPPNNRRVRVLFIAPRSDQLLWCPDLVCSSYRQRITRNDTSYFNAIRSITHIL